MYISVKYLHGSLGVDLEIAKFFVDRNVPQDNAFCNKKLLYVSRGNGYLSIPVFYDLLFRIGVSKALLLEERHVQLMERVMHFALQVERGKISFTQQLQRIDALFDDHPNDPFFYKHLMSYLAQPVLMPMGNLGRVPAALNRADVFLFVLCDLVLQNEKMALALRYWYALHTSYLLMDDIYDYRSDKEQSEENTVMELGDGQDGFAKAFDRLHQNAEILAEVNPILGQFLESSFEDLKKFVP